LELKRATVEAWKQRDEWDKAQTVDLHGILTHDLH
jgi:uncharacterized protein YjcR